MAKEEKNADLERLMLIIVPHLQDDIEENPNLWERESLVIQEYNKQMEDLQARAQRCAMVNGPAEIQCSNCSTPVCMTDDVRTIQNAHHIIVNSEFAERLIMLRSQIPEYEEEDLKYDGTSICSNPDCRRELGGVCEYKTLEFPLLKLKCINFIGRNGGSFKKWKKVPYFIQEISLDDLREIVEERKANMY